MIVSSFKMTFNSNKFKLNQRVFIINITGSQAAYCYGKYHGRGRWVKAWVNWGTQNRPNPEIQKFNIDDESQIVKTVIK